MFGAVPLTKHADVAALLAQSPHTQTVTRAAAQALQEAFNVLRAPPTPAVKPTEVSGEFDKRRQLRISVSAPVQLSDPDNRWMLAATIKNISWGGAAVRCKGLVGEMGQRVCLHLPAGKNQKIQILATVLRIEHDAKEPVYGLRFDSLAPDDEKRLQQVLGILMNSMQHDGRRAESRLVQRLEIEYGDAGEFRATLEDISTSGLMLTVPESLEINQSLLITLSSADTPYDLSLRARVMHQTKVGHDDFAMYRVGLQFEHPDEQLKGYVAEVLTQLAALPPPATIATYGSAVCPLPPFEETPTETASRAAT